MGRGDLKSGMRHSRDWLYFRVTKMRRVLIEWVLRSAKNRGMCVSVCCIIVFRTRVRDMLFMHDSRKDPENSKILCAIS